MDAGTTSCTLMLTGDTGKAAAFKHNLSKFGILEFSRTGRIAINRGEYLFDPMSRYGGAEDVDLGRGFKVDEFKTASRIAEEASARLA